MAERDSGWIAIQSGTPGVGSGTITYTLGANPGPSARTGAITIAGQHVAISQPAPSPAQ